MSVYRYNSTQVCLYVFTFKMQLIGTFPKIFSMTPKGKCKWRGVTIEKVKDVFCYIKLLNLVCQVSCCSVMDRMLHLQGTSIGDLYGYTGPI